MPTVLSMCHGGICRPATRAAIDLAHGRTSSYVTSDIGAIWSGRWHASHLSWKIGAMSLVNVGAVSAATAGSARAMAAVRAHGMATCSIELLLFRDAPRLHAHTQSECPGWNTAKRRESAWGLALRPF